MFLELFLTILVLLQAVDAQQQQQSTNPYATTPTPTNPPQTTTSQQPPQTQIPATTTTTTPPPATIIQTVPTTAATGTVDLGTLMTVLTPILAGIAGMFLKNRKDMDKKDKEVEQKTTGTIDQIIQQIYPLLQQNAQVANVTAKQEVKINEVTNLLYKVMGEEKANEIQGLPEIQQVNLLKDAIKTQILAEHYQQQLEQIPKTINTTTQTQPKVKKSTITTTSQNIQPKNETSITSTNPYASS
jgi:hypothetical protein